MKIQRQDGSAISKNFGDLLIDGDIAYKEVTDFKVGDNVFLNRPIVDMYNAEMSFGYYKITSVEPLEKTIKLSQGEFDPFGRILEDSLVFVEHVKKKELRFKAGDIVKKISSGLLYRIEQIDENPKNNFPYRLENYCGFPWVSEKEISFPYKLYDVVEVIDDSTSGHKAGTIGFITSIFGEINVEECYTIVSTRGVNRFHKPDEIKLYKK